MAFRKILTSDGNPIIVGSTKVNAKKFPPGFCYKIGGRIYTVKEDVTQEVNSPMREIGVSDGTTEIMLVESIIKDLKEPGCEILEPDSRYVKKVAQKKVVKKKKKVVKKKKKVVKKKKKKEKT